MFPAFKVASSAALKVRGPLGVSVVQPSVAPTPAVRGRNVMLDEEHEADLLFQKKIGYFLI